MNFTKEETDLKRAWVKELQQTLRAICWGYKLDLHQPVIEIYRSIREWGAWDPESRTIRISEELILKHSWDVTLNVFKHELAHQIVTDLWGGDGGHGPLFERACDMIGVPEVFRGVRGDAPRTSAELRDDRIGSENMRMLDKVRKLLSLARSGNENEAFLAMQKANELIEKYNIDRIEQNRAARFVYTIINHKKKRIENYQRRICVILMEHFFVQTVCSFLYDPIDGETYQTIELLGTAENVRVGEYVYHFLMNQMEVLWKDYQRKRPGPAARNKRSYRLGVLKGFHDKLDRQAKERMRRHRPEAVGFPTLSALIRSEDNGLKSFVAMRFPRLCNNRSSGSRIDIRTFQAGIDDGSRLILHKGICHQEGYRGRLLTGS